MYLKTRNCCQLLPVIFFFIPVLYDYHIFIWHKALKCCCRAAATAETLHAALQTHSEKILFLVIFSRPECESSNLRPWSRVASVSSGQDLVGTKTQSCSNLVNYNADISDVTMAEVSVHVSSRRFLQFGEIFPS